MKTFLRTERYYTSPNRVRPPGAEKEQDIDLATSFSNSELLKNPSQTAAIEPVLVRRVSINERYYTSPDRVGPPGAEIEQNIDLATSFSNSVRNPPDSIDFLLKNPSQTAAIEPVLVRRASINEVVATHERTLTTNLLSLGQSLLDSIDLLVYPQTSSVCDLCLFSEALRFPESGK
jgi:hypothetical protein